ncbi:MAG TPA: hypothetical protein VN380_10430 [Thermoanaerobaculia bacterium]|nr:hypothetical protein [Thermoanaerobaculia bacterium]
MHVAGFVIYLFASSFTAPHVQVATLQAIPVTATETGEPTVTHEGIPVRSPDPAPPHPLTPRVTLERPATGLARMALALAKAIVQPHGR